MARDRLQYRCRDCGSVHLRWTGRCGRCGEWNTLDEEAAERAAVAVGTAGRARAGGEGVQPAVPLAGVVGGDLPPMPTGLAELDRVLGGGLVPSSVTLIAGEPGIGKSTLLLQLLAGVSRVGHRGLLVTAEESPAQVGMRASRLGVDAGSVWITARTDLGSIRAAAAELRPDVLVVDSVQTISDPATGSAPGTVASVRACATVLAEEAKLDGGPAVILVGHVTKDGSIAGPRVLEHLVDTVLSFEGERHQSLRLLRAVKHRFGPVGELGMWEMTATGLQPVVDAAALLLADRRPESPGSAVLASMDGRRPLLAEIQALVAPAVGGPARRSSSGYESARLVQLMAVLDRRVGLDLRGQDVYVSVVGGLRLSDPGADLAVAMAITSAITGRVLPADLAIVGEVGLGGELRRVPQTARRLQEAARLGFARAAVPDATHQVNHGHAPDRPGGVEGLRLLRFSTLSDALEGVLTAAPAPRPRLRVLHGAGAASFP